MLNVFALKIEQHRYGNRCRIAVEHLRAQERWTRHDLEAFQDARIRHIVAAAYNHSRYYREVMDARGVSPADIRGVKDLTQLPILTKEIARARGADLLTSDTPRRGWLHGHTSGTTGSPLSLWYDRDTCVMTNAVDRRQKEWGGVKPDDWIGLFLGRVVVPPAQIKAPFWRSNRIQRQLWFSSFHMTDANLRHYVSEIKRRKLKFLEGYPSTLYILAQYLRRTGQTLPMQAVFTSSETLHSIQKEAIETALDCEIFDFYGHAERTIFATECEFHSGKHLAEEYGYTEVVDEQGRVLPDGELGFLVGTSLHNTAMPMIRYRTGDLSAIVREPCPCGRTLKRIRSIATKAEDIIVTPDGRMVSPSILTHPFKPFDQIVKSQVIQDRRDHILVKIVPSSEFLPSHQSALHDALSSRLEGMKIDLVVVDVIPNEPSGKFRWVISHVDHSCQFAWDDPATKAAESAS